MKYHDNEMINDVYLYSENLIYGGLWFVIEYQN